MSKMAKKMIGTITLQVPSGKATPAPPIGPILGQKKLNIREFCTSFNERTRSLEPGLVVTVVISVYSDNSFTFVIKSSPSSILIKRAAGVSKGSARPHADKVGVLSKAQIEEIAKIKLPDLNTTSLESAIRTVAGSARSMGITVTEGA